VRRQGALDTLEVQVEARAAAALAGKEALTALETVARRKITEMIGLTADVSVVLPKTIERSAGKARRVVDLRASDRCPTGSRS
jgi:phenylacetate-CoA ligase